MQSFGRPFSNVTVRRVFNDVNATRPFRCLHATVITQTPRKRYFFSSNAALQQQTCGSEPVVDLPPVQKRKPVRSPAGKISLRRVAVEAQRSRETSPRKPDALAGETRNNTVTAISVADQFDMDVVVRILRSHGFPINPDETDFETDQVVHTRGVNNGDIFVFPSGSLVAWSLPEEVVSDLATKTLLPAALYPRTELIEMEDLEYMEDPTRESSCIKGDVITLGTKMALQSDQQVE